jgi:hypothetical protein
MTESVLVAMPKDCDSQTVQAGMAFVARHLFVALTVPNPEVVKEYTHRAYHMAQMLRHTTVRSSQTVNQEVQTTTAKPRTRKRKATTQETPSPRCKATESNTQVQSSSPNLEVHIADTDKTPHSPETSRAASPSLYFVFP